MKNVLIVLGCLIFTFNTSIVHAGEAENIQACVNKSKEYAGIILDEFSATYEGNWLSASIVRWDNVFCEAKVGIIYNLTINNKNYIYERFSGKDSYNLNNKLETKTNKAIKKLQSRITLLEQRMENVTEKLKEHNPSHQSLEEYINSGIQKSIGISESTETNIEINNDLAKNKVTKKRKVSNKKLGTYFVVSDKLNVRLSPNKNGSITNTLYKRQKVEVYETKGNWARISDYYDGAVEGGTGNVSRWVYAKYLSKNRPVEEKISVTSQVGEAIKSSDDFTKYQSVFVSASEKLLKSRSCSMGDFKEVGGWWRSSMHKPKPVYFTYCGGMHKDNRIYLNVSTGDTFR